MSAMISARLPDKPMPVSAGPLAPPTVLVVDDDESVRESLESLINSAGWKPEVFESASEFLSRPRLLGPTCLVLDVTLPGLSGLELQSRIAVDRANMPIIFITGNGNVPTSVRAMKAGAVEFLTKPIDGEMLISAIRDALSRSMIAIKQEAETRAICADYASLTPREQEVMELVARGLLNKQVGGNLGICENTVKAHRGRVMRRMKAKSLADLVKMAAVLRLG